MDVSQYIRGSSDAAEVRVEEGAGSQQLLVSRHLESHQTFRYESHRPLGMVPGEGTKVLGIYI
jgi:hypothetical protein